MSTELGFFYRHKLIIIGLAGVILGVVLNSMVRDYENRKFLATLVSKKEELQGKAQSGTITQAEAKMLDKLDAEIYIMRFRCDA